jgi:hypothetical protein
MVNEMTTTALASVINSESILEARLAFQDAALLAGEVRLADLTGVATKAASFPVYAEASVTSPASETTDVTTNSDITPTDVVLTVARRTIRIEPSDLGIASSVDNMSVRLGQIIGAARAKKVDQDILGVMTTTFTSSVGATNSTDVSIANLLTALLTLEGNEANRNLKLILHPKQWNHIRGDMVLVSGTAASSDRTIQAQEVATSGRVFSNLLGAEVIVTPRVQTGTDTNAMYLGVFGWVNEGIGYAIKNVNAELGLPDIELDRNPSTGSTEFVMNYYDKAGIIRPSALVLVKSQTY